VTNDNVASLACAGNAVKEDCPIERIDESLTVSWFP
jgi:hypothetical protein